MARKRLTIRQQEYKHEIQRIKRAIKRLEKKGYIITVESVLPSKPQRITANVIQSLRDVTPKYLRETFKLSEKATKLQQKLSESNIHDIEKELQRLADTYGTDSQSYKAMFDIWKQERVKIDTLQQALLIDNPNYRNQFSQVNLAFKGLTDSIEELKEYAPEVQTFLKQSLSQEIDTYGYQAVAENIAQLPSDLVEETSRVLRYADKHYHAKQFNKLLTAITGTLLTSEQLMALSALVESDGEDYL